tara:strand:- start:34028 stop:35434 length:1407 start_codon:yes stop_codon:yes gene_type:complete
MIIEEAKQLINGGESHVVELKKTTANLKAAAQTLCAFLNGAGGTVFVGVDDKLSIIGQHVTDKTRLDISSVLKKFEPTANIEVEYLSISKDRHLIAFTARPDSRCIPYTFDGRAYERQQADTHTMPQNRYQQLLLARHVQPQSWEVQPAVEMSLDDLDIDEINKTVANGIEKGTLDPALGKENVEHILTKFGLYKVGQLNNAAVVLFAENPGSHYAQCVLRMARFKGLAKGEFIDSKQVAGNAFDLLQEAESFIHRNTAVSGKVMSDQMIRTDTAEYPFKAIREALINALCHRDYASPGGAITLTIYDDRLEIINTGLLPEGITLVDLKTLHTSHPRNPNIVNVFYRCGLIEAMGMGIQEIINIYSNANIRPPEFLEQAGTFVIRLWSRIHSSHIDDPSLTERQQHILHMLQGNRLSPSQLLIALENVITDRTLRSDLLILKMKGYVDSTGEGKQKRWFVVANPETRK